MKTFLIFIFFFAFFLNNVFSQSTNWYAKTTGPGGLSINKIIQDDDGNIFVGGQFSDSVQWQNYLLVSPKYLAGLFIAKLASSGEIIWLKSSSSNEGASSVLSLAIDKKGDVYATGFFSSLLKLDQINWPSRGGYDLFVCKITSQGKTVWVNGGGGEETIESSNLGWFADRGRDIAVDSKGEVIICGSIANNTIINGVNIGKEAGRAFVAKLNASGNFYWAKTIASLSSICSRDYAGTVTVDQYDNFYLAGAVACGYVTDCGSSASYGSGADGYIIKFNSKGYCLSFISYMAHDNDGITDIAVDKDGNTFYTGFRGDYGISTESIPRVLGKYNADGSRAWEILLNSNTLNNENGEDNLCLDIAGNPVVSYSVGWQAYIQTYDSKTNELLSSKTIAHPSRIPSFSAGFLIKSIFVNKENNLLCGSGYFAHEGVSNTGYLIGRTVPFLLTPKLNSSVIINGNVFYDFNADCKKDENEPSVRNTLLVATPGPFYALTDPKGNYDFVLPPGDYTINLLKETFVSAAVDAYCPSEKQIKISAPTIGEAYLNNNFGIKTNPCTDVSVSITQARLRRCFTNTLSVLCENSGTIDAKDLMLRVLFPRKVKPVSSSVSWNYANDSVLIYNIPVLKTGERLSIDIVDSVVCGDEQLLGLTECIKAVISPKSSSCRIASPDWDKSNLEVFSQCLENGLVRFVIKNGGAGNMREPTEYRILSNNKVIYTAMLQLKSFELFSFLVSGTGRTLRVEVNQTKNHPELKYVFLTVEKCKSAEGEVTKGLVNSLPQDNSRPESSTSCAQIVGSYDPNIKEVIPTGIGSDNAIKPGETFNYKIHFQNTGTDTVFTVVLKDTLDEALDLSSLSIGAASHPFQWNLRSEKKPVLTFVFNGINMPDSSTNVLLSNGFIDFSIKSKPSIQEGTIIKNQAAIYFDYNNPIVTNTVFHTIKSEYITDFSQANLITFENLSTGVTPKNDPMTLIVYPNPSTGNVYFEIEKYKDIDLEIVDVTGNLIFQESVNSSTIEISKSVFKKGIHYYFLKDKGEVVKSGKFIIIE